MSLFLPFCIDFISLSDCRLIEDLDFCEGVGVKAACSLYGT